MNQISLLLIFFLSPVATLTHGHHHHKESWIHCTRRSWRKEWFFNILNNRFVIGDLCVYGRFFIHGDLCLAVWWQWMDLIHVQLWSRVAVSVAQKKKKKLSWILNDFICKSCFRIFLIRMIRFWFSIKLKTHMGFLGMPWFRFAKSRWLVIKKKILSSIKECKRSP